MDAVRGNYGYTARETAPRREVQRADLVEKVRKSAPAEALSEADVKQVTAYYNKALQDVDQVRKPKYPQDLSACFPRSAEDAELREKLQVRLQDNDTAREVKDEYTQLLNQVNKESNQAQKMVEKLGPGTHTLSNGDVVEVSQDDSGNVEVYTESPDGSSKRVFYNTENPSDVRIQSTVPGSPLSQIERKGQTLNVDQNCRRVASYSLDEDRVVRVQVGPAFDDYTKTTVNPDGSTDTRELIYISDEPDANGDHNVYEDTHQPSRFRGMIAGQLGEALGGAVTGGVGRGVSGGGAAPPHGLGDPKPEYILGAQTSGAVGGGFTGGSIGRGHGAQAGGGVGGGFTGGSIGHGLDVQTRGAVGGKLGEAFGGAVTGGVGRGVSGGGALPHGLGEPRPEYILGDQPSGVVGGETDEVPKAAPAE